MRKKRSKPQRGENNIKISKKTTKKNKKTEQSTQHGASIYQSLKARKKQTKKATDCAERGTLDAKILSQQNSAKLELTK